MNKTRIACAVLAGTFGLVTVASAQDWRSGRHDGNGEQRWEQRHDRNERNERNDRDARQERHEGRNWNNSGYQQRGYVVNHPRYVYNQPNYYAHTQRYYRGGYLPRQYLASNYYVNDWRAYPGLYAPPYGQQWVNVGGEFLLVALATGLIANLLVN